MEEKAEEFPEVEKETAPKNAQTFDMEKWQPKTGIGKKVKGGEITNIDYLLDNGMSILEAEIVDSLVPNATTELLMVGQSKGKFGGGQRRVFKQTQKKTQEGNKPRFGTFCIVGDFDGHVGLGYGKSKETVPAREKAIRRSKLNVIKIRRGCGSWQCGCKEAHSIPYSVEGKCGSCKLKIMPAPKGTGLIVEKECAKLLRLAGIKDVISRTEGKTNTKTNLVAACFEALKRLVAVKTSKKNEEDLGIIEGNATKNDLSSTITKEVSDEQNSGNKN